MILDRYVLRMWAGPFFLSIGFLLAVMLLQRALKLLDLMAEKSLDWWLFARMLWAVFPYFLVLVAPIAFMLAIQRVMMSLQESSELDALRAAGLSYLRVFRPLLIVALVLWGGLSWASVAWVPSGVSFFQVMQFRLASLTSGGEVDPQVFARIGENLTLFYNGSTADGVMQGVLIEDGRSSVPVLYLCRTAHLEGYSKGMHLVLENGVRLEGEGSAQRMLAFHEYRVHFPMKRLSSAVQGKSLAGRDLDELLQMRHGAHGRAAMVEVSRRFALPLLVLVFVLFAVPLSEQRKRSHSAVSYVAGLAFVFACYQLIMAALSLEGQGVWPLWAVWALLGALLVSGLALFVITVARYSPLIGLNDATSKVWDEVKAWMSRRKAVQ